LRCRRPAEARRRGIRRARQGPARAGRSEAPRGEAAPAGTAGRGARPREGRGADDRRVRPRLPVGRRRRRRRARARRGPADEPSLSAATAMSGEDGGIRDAAIRVVASSLALLRTRLELVSVEFAQERERLKSSIVLLAVAAVAFALTAMVVTLGVIAWFWDDHRYAAVAIIAVIYALAGIVALVAR